MEQSGDPLPARKIYEGLLPDIVKELTDPVIPYWPGSPYGGQGWDTTDPTVGDIVRIRFPSPCASACDHHAACLALTRSINGTSGRAKSATTTTGI
jgi:hypothetical protein